MKKTKGESLTERLFKQQFNIDCVAIPREQNKKTADYFLQINGKTIAVCEVKDIEHQSGEGEGWKDNMRDVNDESRVGGCIQSAFQQLQMYNEPKVLVIVDFDDLPRPLYSLNAAVTGIGGSERIIITETLQGVSTSTNSNHVARGRIKNIVKKIDLYFWINVHNEKKNASRIFTDNSVGKELQNLIWNRCNLNLKQT